MSTDFRSENSTKDATNSEKLIICRNLVKLQRFFVRNLAAIQGYCLTCLMSNLTERAFYTDVGTISPYSHRINGIRVEDSAMKKTSILLLLAVGFLLTQETAYPLSIIITTPEERVQKSDVMVMAKFSAVSNRAERCVAHFTI